MSEGVYQAKRPVSRFQAGGTPNLTTGTPDGSVMVLQSLSAALLGAGAIAGRGATLLVAAADASPEMRAAANYVCDGLTTSNDQIEINNALAALPASGGTVLLSEGTFHIATPIFFGGPRRILRGMGMRTTTIRVIDNGGAPINGSAVNVNADYCELRDLAVDGNKAVQTPNLGGQILVDAGNSINPVIERVFMFNSTIYGLVIRETTQNALVRDCMVESCGNNGAIIRAVAGQPALVSGCTVKTSGAVGWVCDNGPVVFSNCHSLSNSTWGWFIGNVAASVVSLNQCTASNNGQAGFYTAAARTQFTGCQAIANVNYGFHTEGAQTQHVGCIAAGTVSTGVGFYASLNAADTVYNGCSAHDNASSGFYHNAAARALYTGCRSVGHPSYGWYIIAGEVNIRGCVIHGAGIYGHGVYLAGGANHSVHACRIRNVGGYGIWLEAAATHSQITNNLISDVSLANNGSYVHIYTVAPNGFIHGNTLRDPVAGNRPAYGIWCNTGANNTFVGHNDTRGVGVAAANVEVVTAVNLPVRRVVNLQLDYLSALETGWNTASGAWLDVMTAQNFRVDSPRSLIKVSCQGALHSGNSGTLGTINATRVVIDFGLPTQQIKSLGGQTLESTNGYQNSLSGAGQAIFTNLPVGTRTIKVQVIQSIAGQVWLRAGQVDYEFLRVQVVEFAR